MRTLKFRAWDGVSMWENIIPLPGKPPLIIEMQNITGELKPLSVDVIMQYSELKDKNGKEIYEGDILSVPSYCDGDYMKRECLATVFFNGGVFDLMCTDKYSREMYTVLSEGAYVIGNIYENPKIIKEYVQKRQEEKEKENSTNRINQVLTLYKEYKELYKTLSKEERRKVRE